MTKKKKLLAKQTYKTKAGALAAQKRAPRYGLEVRIVKDGKCYIAKYYG